MNRHFFYGFLCGYIVSIFIFQLLETLPLLNRSMKWRTAQQQNTLSTSLQNQQLSSNLSKETLYNNNSKLVTNDNALKEERTFTEEVTIDDILFIVVTGEKRLHHAHIAAQTWIRHIPLRNLFFFSDHNCSNLPNCRNVGGAEEGRRIKSKVVVAFNTSYHQLPHKKWFMKLDDDTFLVVKHLLRLLQHYNSSQLHYVGRYYNNWGNRYCEGGAGYLFSHRLMEKMIPNGKYYNCMMFSCPYPFEDVCTGLCMEELYNLSCDQTTTGFHQELPRDAKEYAVEDFYGNAITFHPVRNQETATILDLIYYRQEWHKKEQTPAATSEWI